MFKFLIILILWTSSAALAQRFELLPYGVQQLLFYERQRMDRSADADLLVVDREIFDPRYSPEGGQLFQSKGFWIAENLLEAYSEQMSARTAKRFIRKNRGQTEYLLIVHPQSENFYRDLLTKTGKRLDKPQALFWTAPTASSRSVIIWEDGKESEPHFVKVSLDIVIGDARRTLKTKEAIRSIGINKILNLAAIDQVSFFNESLSIAPQGMERGAQIIREIPSELLTGQVEYMPLFALYGRPNKKVLPELVKMMRQSKVPPIEFVIANIIQPYAEIWTHLAVVEGIAIEGHGQNILLQLNDKKQPARRFVLRDFGGFTVDLKHRARSGKALPDNLPHVDSVADEYFQTKFRGVVPSSLEYYFVAGFVYSLTQRMQEWAEQGLIKPEQRLDSGTFTRALFRHISQELSRMSAVKVTIPAGDYAALGRAVYAARRKYTPRPAASCEAIYGGYHYLMGW